MTSVPRALAALILVVPLAARAQAPAKAPPAAEERPKLLVSPLTPQGASAEHAAALTDAVVQALAERGLFRVLSSKDVNTILSAERQRVLLGACGEDGGEGCASSLGEILGTAFVMTGSLSRVGSAYQLTLQTIDTKEAKPIGRSTRLAGDLATLTLLVPWAAAEATGSPLPPPRSRVLQYSLMAAGSGLVIGGGFLGMLALSREAVLGQELCPGGPGACEGQNLGFLADYRDEAGRLQQQKTGSLVMLAAGAALVGVGIWLLPPPEQGPRIALVPAARGFALVGSFP